uniref:Uncharacterized protein n=1 Tax=Romanomermis culicivorax TaxID=13658 RepID=A0A915JAD4_ROMCU
MDSTFHLEHRAKGPGAPLADAKHRMTFIGILQYTIIDNPRHKSQFAAFGENFPCFSDSNRMRIWPIHRARIILRLPRWCIANSFVLYVD